MRQYRGVQGGQRVQAIVAAIEASGGRVLHAGPATVAPFEFKVALADGSKLELVCYAFTANKYRQGGRPTNEHRFQVKYGSDFKRPHTLFIDPDHQRVTLFFGIHEERGVFVAADPAMHNPTWFSRSVEFKDDDISEAERRGWHAWERDRTAVRRRVHPQADLRTEVLLAFRPEHFLTYAQLERIATGLDPGERLLLIEKTGHDLRVGRGSEQLATALSSIVPPALGPDLLGQFKLSTDELLNMIARNFRLLAAVRGGVAELHLQSLLKRMSGVRNVTKIDRDGEPDFRVTFKGREIRIECKNVLRKLTKGVPKVDFQKTRASKKDPCSRYYSAAQFEVLAACLHPITEQWEFKYCLTAELDPHRRCPRKLSENVLVEGPRWEMQLPELLRTFR